MNLIFRVITAAHARGTHDRLAFDGLAHMHGTDAEGWRRLFLKHAADLVRGSQAPDDEFKDFKNHVLFPRDGFWGGAAAAAQKWYAQLVVALGTGDWATAVTAAGILSHYVTDPVLPFNTAQSEASNSIQRAFEWSVFRSYDDLKRIAAADAARTINIPDGDDWLAQLLHLAATEANSAYEKLIAHYDIKRGVVDASSGLDVVAQRIAGDQLGLAAALFAAVLERAIAESKAAAPAVNLGLDAALSMLRLPISSGCRKIAGMRERALVERIYDELMATGTVEKNLPEHQRVVSDLYAVEVLGHKKPAATAKAAKAEDSKAGAARIARKAGVHGTAAADVPAGRPVLPMSRIPIRTLPPPSSELSRAAPAPGVREVPLDEPPRPAPRAADQVTPLAPLSRFRGQPREADPVVAMAEAPAASKVAALVSAPSTVPARRHPMPQQEASGLATAAAAAASVSGYTGGVTAMPRNRRAAS